MSRSINTVSDLIREWTIGLGGNLPVKELEQTWGTAWRKCRTESKFFSRRKPIFDEYESMLALGVTETESVNRLTTMMQCAGGSLDGLQKFLRSRASL